MAHYVDGFIVPVPKRKLAAYLKMAKTASKVWKKYGALEYYEAVADDVKVGKVTSFPRSVKRKGNETVFFSWIIYKSRAHRDAVLKKVMKDPIFKDMDMDDMPFDGMRMIYGGFKIAVAA
jgi:uncharacterized protein YbaA (DUF1428 family)